jgi:hypothetical protein
MSQITKDLLAWLRLPAGTRVPSGIQRRLVNDMILHPTNGALTQYGVLEVRALAKEGYC